MTPARPRYRRIERAVSELLSALDVTRAPVPVEDMVHHAGAKLVYHNFENEISGLLLRGNGAPLVAVASEQPRTRQRFTIAHELGHLMLHEPTDVHVDKGFSLLLRSSRSSEAIDVIEIEANAFAAALLMPERILRNEMKRRVFDVEDDAQIIELAKEYEVSSQAMTYRITNLIGRGLI